MKDIQHQLAVVEPCPILKPLSPILCIEYIAFVVGHCLAIVYCPSTRLSPSAEIGGQERVSNSPGKRRVYLHPVHPLDELCFVLRHV